MADEELTSRALRLGLELTRFPVEQLRAVAAKKRERLSELGWKVAHDLIEDDLADAFDAAKRVILGADEQASRRETPQSACGVSSATQPLVPSEGERVGASAPIPRAADEDECDGVPRFEDGDPMDDAMYAKWKAARAKRSGSSDVQ